MRRTIAKTRTFGAFGITMYAIERGLAGEVPFERGMAPGIRCHVFRVRVPEIGQRGIGVQIRFRDVDYGISIHHTPPRARRVCAACAEEG